MKPKLLCCLMIVMIGSLGCASLTKPESLESKSKAVAWLATAKLTKDHPEWSPHFAQARDDLGILLAAETIDTATVLAIVNRLPVDELRGNDATLYIGGAVMFFEDELGRISIESPAERQAIVRGLIAGITLGLPYAQ
jgi:hypothetical protein